jgi:hypothetical protein
MEGSTNKVIQNFFISVPDVYVVGERVFILKSDRFFVYRLLNSACLPILNYNVFLFFKSHFFKTERKQFFFSAKKTGVQ